MATSEAIMTKTYQFLLFMLPLLAKLPRDQKFLVADRYETRVLDLLDLYVRAYYSSKENKSPLLRDANIGLEQLRYLTRLLHDMRFINHEKYGAVSGHLDEIGKMTGGWLKSIA